LKVSYDRPFAQHSTLTGYNPYNNIILAWEYNMIRWLESQGYNVSYVTNVDVHANPQLLRSHKVFLSVGHDEYWSLEGRQNVELSRDAGVNLAFFSANTCYWRVRFENSSTGGINRIMTSYKDNLPEDPVAPTKRYRSSPNIPESQLLGVMYLGGRWQSFYADGFDFVVKNSADPYYAHTGLQDGDRLSGLVGFEWDAINPNALPNGQMVILGESQQGQGLDDDRSGDFPAGTDARLSHAVRYTAPSGAKVFSTGSVQWMWGLDSADVSGPREDLRAQQIAVNILADMGARPLTPGAGIVVP
jgi:hypothetical protein